MTIKESTPARPLDGFADLQASTSASAKSKMSVHSLSLPKAEEHLWSFPPLPPLEEDAPHLSPIPTTSQMSLSDMEWDRIPGLDVPPAADGKQEQLGADARWELPLGPEDWWAFQPLPEGISSPNSDFQQFDPSGAGEPVPADEAQVPSSEAAGPQVVQVKEESLLAECDQEADVETRAGDAAAGDEFEPVSDAVKVEAPQGISEMGSPSSVCQAAIAKKPLPRLVAVQRAWDNAEKYALEQIGKRRHARGSAKSPGQATDVKLQKRLQKNRDSAFTSRIRRRMYTEKLEKGIIEEQAEAEKLKKEKEQLLLERKALYAELDAMLAESSAKRIGNAKTPASVAELLTTSQKHAIQDTIAGASSSQTTIVNMMQQVLSPVTAVTQRITDTNIPVGVATLFIFVLLLGLFVPGASNGADYSQCVKGMDVNVPGQLSIQHIGQLYQPLAGMWGSNTRSGWLPPSVDGAGGSSAQGGEMPSPDMLSWWQSWAATSEGNSLLFSFLGSLPLELLIELLEFATSPWAVGCTDF